MMIDFKKCVSFEKVVVVVSLRLKVALSSEILDTTVVPPKWLPKVIEGDGWLKDALVVAILRKVLHIGLLILDLTDVLENNLQILCLVFRGNN